MTTTETASISHSRGVGHIPQGPGAKIQDLAGLFVIMAASLILQLNAIAHHGYIGQDYGAHAAGVIGTSTDWRVAFDFAQGEQATNPPLYVLLGGLIYRLSGDNMAALGLATSAINVVSLGWFLLYIRPRFSRYIWFALALVLAFVPFRIIHSTVISHDALTFPLLMVCVWLLARDARIATNRERTINLALVGLALVLAVFEKYSFIALVPVVVWVPLHNSFERKQLNWKFTLGILLTILPTLLIYSAMMLQTRAVGGFGARQWRDFSVPPTMTLEDVVLPKLADLRLLDAPKYDEGMGPGGSVADMELIVFHRYSYLGLLHLASFTDILNVFQNDPRPGIPGARGETNQKLMSLADKLSVPVTLLVIAGVTFTALQVGKGYIRRTDSRPEIEVLLLASLALFGFVAVGLTLVSAPYLSGYWLPRLVMAPLIVFIALGFMALDHWLPRRAVAPRLATLCYSIALAVSYCAFLIP